MNDRKFCDWCLANKEDAAAFLYHYFKAVDMLIAAPFDLAPQQRVQAVHRIAKAAFNMEGILNEPKEKMKE